MTKEKTLPGPLRQHCMDPRKFERERSQHYHVKRPFSREITKTMIDGSDRKI